SCIGEPIYAEKATVTGSIGVFSMKLSFGSLMRRIGVHVESITLDDSAAIFAIDRTWNDGDVKNMQEFIDNFYSQFLKLVSKSRKMPVDKVEPLAGGRVWSGEQAKKLGLIDTIGGVDDCLDVIAKKAELDDYKVIHRPIRQSGLDLLELLGEGDEEEIFSGSLVRNVIQVLQSRGFHFETTVQLIQDSVQRGDGRPAVWALHPAELIVK
ncbi:MAG: S49 family peptidase, partial [Planctomycetales bacterium]|nr:S49 family peptidase [Planctomycetales bacterium]